MCFQNDKSKDLLGCAVKYRCGKMRIGFDLDGVLCDINIAVIRLIDNLQSEDARKSSTKWYYKGRKPLLNPYLFVTEKDEIFIITGRNKELEQITRKWVNKYLPDLRNLVWIVGRHNDSLIHTNDDKKIGEWVKRRTKEKAEMIIFLGLDVYFDDNQQTVEGLRKLCPNTKIINYGGWVNGT